MGRIPLEVDKIFGDGSGDWLEDAQYPNGNYTCKCSICGQTFIGHKRRVVCKVCAEEETTVNKRRYYELLEIEDKYNKLNDWYWSRPK